jgi:hypothetical protein
MVLDVDVDPLVWEGEEFRFHFFRFMGIQSTKHPIERRKGSMELE